MANPQLENGYLSLANEIAGALARTRISGTEWQLLWVILRLTYGWQKKKDAIALQQFHEKTGLPKPHIVRYLKKLLHKKIILVAQKDNKGVPTYQFNKDFETWEPLPKKITLPKKAMEIAQKGNEHCPKRQKSLPKKVPTKDKRTSSKETITKDKYLDSVFLSKDEFSKLNQQHGETFTQACITKLNAHKMATGATYKSDYWAMIKWVINAVTKDQGGDNGRASRVLGRNAGADSGDVPEAGKYASLGEELFTE